VEEAGKLAQKQNMAVSKKFINYSDPVVVTTLKEVVNHYNKTGRYLTHEDAMLSDQPLLSLPRGTICLTAAKALQQSVQTNGTKPPA
jgi:hypothetical protein